ncbi:MAG: hypothetical protein R3D59_17725 [Paracoccaceae bacterium]
MFWLIAVVVATDIAGYFAGWRIISRPKFWPGSARRKPGPGTVARAGSRPASSSSLFAGTLGPAVVWLSVLLSFASQMGDAADRLSTPRA